MNETKKNLHRKLSRSICESGDRVGRIQMLPYFEHDIGVGVTWYSLMYIAKYPEHEHTLACYSHKISGHSNKSCAAR